MTANAGTVRARIFLLGRFEVEVEGRRIPAASWRKRRAVDVLTAVALASGRALHREELIDRFWPDKDLDAGANNLHRALHEMRRAARPSRLVRRAGRRHGEHLVSLVQLTPSSIAFFTAMTAGLLLASRFDGSMSRGS